MKNNVLLIDKPKGITSHDVVDEVRKLTGEQKVGHAGTLDPMATGLLIVLVGRGATKRQSEFMGLEKEYVAEVTFGLETDTYDADGKTANRAPLPAVRKLKRKDVEKELKSFGGFVEQQVPPYSAVKINGKPLYKYARGGRLDEITLPMREVEIKKLELLEFYPMDSRANLLPKVRLRVVCSKGTYIRSLAHDLGQKLGTGAFLSALRRTRIGQYCVENAVSLEKLE